jgi:hypothetical protein
MAPAAAALVQAIRAHEHADNLPRAVTLAALALELYPDDAQAVERAQALVDEHGPHLLRVEVMCDDCELDLDGELQEYKTFYVDADSSYTLTADFDTGKRTARVAGMPGDTQSIVLTAPPAEVAPVPPVDDGFPDTATDTTDTTDTTDSSDDYTWRTDDRPKDDAEGEGGKPFGPVVTWIGVGLTGALAIGSVVATIDAVGGVDAYETAADDANAACQRGDANCVQLHADAEDLLVEGQNKETLTTILWAATGVAAVGTLIIALTLTDWDGDDSSASLSLGPDHAAAVFSTKF